MKILEINEHVSLEVGKNADGNIYLDFYDSHGDGKRIDFDIEDDKIALEISEEIRMLIV